MKESWATEATRVPGCLGQYPLESSKGSASWNKSGDLLASSYGPGPGLSAGHGAARQSSQHPCKAAVSITALTAQLRHGRARVPALQSHAHALHP